MLAVSIEDSGDDAVRNAAAEAFTGWENQLADALQQRGVDLADAEQLATLVVAAAEGTVAMCRARRDSQPLDRVTARLEALIAAAVDE